MNPTKSSKNSIFELIKQYKEISTKDIQDRLGISKPVLHKHLNKLIEEGKITKVGATPRVYYIINDKQTSSNMDSAGSKINKLTVDFIDKNYLYITASGDIKFGFEGFSYWCKRTKQDIGKTANEYLVTVEKYNTYKKDGYIDGSAKLTSSFTSVGLDKLYYLDFYSIERFGKTKLGQMLLYAKQSQSKRIIADLVQNIKPAINDFITKYKIDAVGFIPPTVKREVQFMRELEKGLSIELPIIKIIKVSGEIAVPQKTLSKIEDRIENARKTIMIKENRTFKNILLIDDAVGSGATLNETALKLKQKISMKSTIIGLSITGSYKGFDVISEI